MEKKDTEGTESNNELRSELLHALFALKNLHFHRLGQQEFGVAGISRMQSGAAGERGLNIQEFTLLKQLRLREERGEPGSARFTEMGDYLRVSKAAISQMLGGLERRGLVTREPDPSNRRTIIVNPTEKGCGMIDDFEREFDSYLIMLIEQFGEKDTREIIRLIYKFTGIVEANQRDPKEAG